MRRSCLLQALLLGSPQPTGAALGELSGDRGLVLSSAFLSVSALPTAPPLCLSQGPVCPLDHPHQLTDASPMQQQAPFPTSSSKCLAVAAPCPPPALFS